MTRASQGAADPLSALGYTSDVEKHPVCQEVRSFVEGMGKKGSDVRRWFSDPPYGWSRDAIDGALLALLAGGFLRATRSGQPVTAKGMTQQQVGVTEFFIEGVVVSAVHRIGVRKVASAMGLPTKSGGRIRGCSGDLGAPPARSPRLPVGRLRFPNPPDATIVSQLRELAGNRQIVGVAEQADSLIAHYMDWSAASEAARERLPEWEAATEASSPCS